MKISEYIEELEAIKEEHGDLDMETYAIDCARISVRAPTVDYRAVLFGRESKPRFFSDFRFEKDNEDRRGEKVCKL